MIFILLFLMTDKYTGKGKESGWSPNQMESYDLISQPHLFCEPHKLQPKSTRIVEFRNTLLYGKHLNPMYRNTESVEMLSHVQWYLQTYHSFEF
jgi:hypothetical protein